MDPYGVLGLKRGCTLAEARKAYILKSQLLHPDRHRDASRDVQDAATEAMRELNAAWDAVRREVADETESTAADATARSRDESSRSPGGAASVTPTGQVERHDGTNAAEENTGSLGPALLEPDWTPPSSWYGTYFDRPAWRVHLIVQWIRDGVEGYEDIWPPSGGPPTPAPPPNLRSASLDPAVPSMLRQVYDNWFSMRDFSKQMGLVPAARETAERLSSGSLLDRAGRPGWGRPLIGWGATKYLDVRASFEVICGELIEVSPQAIRLSRDYFDDISVEVQVLKDASGPIARDNISEVFLRLHRVSETRSSVRLTEHLLAIYWERYCRMAMDDYGLSASDAVPLVVEALAQEPELTDPRTHSERGVNNLRARLRSVT